MYEVGSLDPFTDAQFFTTAFPNKSVHLQEIVYRCMIRTDKAKNNRKAFHIIESLANENIDQLAGCSDDTRVQILVPLYIKKLADQISRRTHYKQLVEKMEAKAGTNQPKVAAAVKNYTTFLISNGYSTYLELKTAEVLLKYQDKLGAHTTLPSIPHSKQNSSDIETQPSSPQGSTAVKKPASDLFQLANPDKKATSIS